MILKQGEESRGKLFEDSKSSELNARKVRAIREE